MSNVIIYDPPMCCSSGVCGPNPDESLMDVETMLAELKKSSFEVNRYLINQSPEKFKEDPRIIKLIQEKQLKVLPITVVDGEIIKTGSYPTIDEVHAAKKG
ncbi:MAG: arsenite efflux transporter metallochaperone ArsD [Candidatus Saccharimonadales bacterium]|nr:arsenite efflux transporter metallochaperone ArsD [Candidatus Saccharibacteria bacterium]